MGDAVRLALTTFSVARVRGPREVTRRVAGGAVMLGPLVGLALAGVAGLLVVGLRELQADHAGPQLPAGVAIALLALLTRGLHLDGLVDTADGLASYRPAAEARRIMKEPGVGALGAATLVLNVVLQVVALQSCIAAGRGTASLLLAVVLGRVAVVCACTPSIPAATPDGLGAMVAGTVSRWVPAVLAAIVALLAGAAEALDQGGSAAERGVDAGRAVLAVVVALLVARLLRRHVVRRLDGITGDVLGALIEVTTTVALLTMSLDLPESWQP